MNQIKFFLIFIFFSFSIAFGSIKNTLNFKNEVNHNSGTVSIYTVNDVTIHRFANSFVYSYIIETKNNLTIIDALIDSEAAGDFLSYAQTLSKPIDGIFITHSHFDHIGGIDVFKDYKIYAFQSTLNDIAKSSSQKFNFITLEENQVITIDNLEYIINNIPKAHAADHLVILLPEVGGVVAGDLVVKNIHQNRLIIKDFDAFINGLKWFKTLPNYSFILVGHGDIASFKDINSNIKFVKTAKKIYSQSANLDEYFINMNQKYKTIEGYDNFQRMFFEGKM